MVCCTCPRITKLISRSDTNFIKYYFQQVDCCMDHWFHLFVGSFDFPIVRYNKIIDDASWCLGGINCKCFNNNQSVNSDCYDYGWLLYFYCLNNISFIIFLVVVVLLVYSRTWLWFDVRFLSLVLCSVVCWLLCK